MRSSVSLTMLALALGIAGCAEPADEQTPGEAADTADEQPAEEATDIADEQATEEDPVTAEEQGTEDEATEPSPYVVDIVSEGHNFEMPGEIPSGWVTFRYHNDADETHFALLGDLAEGITAQDSREEVVPVFQDAMDLINEGDPEAGFAQFENMPEWSAETVYMGGPGFVAPGGVAETTVYLEPGNYQVECYVKTDGVWHTESMLVDLTVTDEESGAPEPTSDFEVLLTNDGLEIDGDVQAGEQTFAVTFVEQMLHGNALWHDVHVARIDDDTDLDDLAAWMNWANPDGLEAPAPAEFIGGAQMMPEGSTAYVTVDLQPGEYAFIAEVDDPQSKGMLQTVTVP